MTVVEQLRSMWSKEEPRAYLIFAAVCMLFAIGLISVVGYNYYENMDVDRAPIFSARCYEKGGFPVSLDKYVDGYGDRVCVESLKLIHIPEYP